MDGISAAVDPGAEFTGAGEGGGSVPEIGGQRASRQKEKESARFLSSGRFQERNTPAAALAPRAAGIHRNDDRRIRPDSSKTARAKSAQEHDPSAVM